MNWRRALALWIDPSLAEVVARHEIAEALLDCEAPGIIFAPLPQDRVFASGEGASWIDPDPQPRSLPGAFPSSGV